MNSTQKQTDKQALALDSKGTPIEIGMVVDVTSRDEVSSEEKTKNLCARVPEETFDCQWHVTRSYGFLNLVHARTIWKGRSFVRAFNPAHLTIAKQTFQPTLRPRDLADWERNHYFVEDGWD